MAPKVIGKLFSQTIILTIFVMTLVIAKLLINNRDELVKVIESNALPIGIMPDIESEENIYSLNDGDFIIMLSDGITDSFGENPHGAICDLVSNMNTGNPQELADRILSEALNCNRHQAKDDMSVLVAGIWAK